MPSHSLQLFSSGVELDEKIEKGGCGTVAKRFFFTCPQGHAIFTTRKKITLVADLEQRKAKAAAAAASSTSTLVRGKRRAGAGGGRASNAKSAPSAVPAVAPKPRTAKQKEGAAKERLANLKKVHKSPTKHRPATSLSPRLTKDSRVWLPDDDKVFVPATVTFDEGGLLTVQMDDTEQERTMTITSPKDYPLRRNPDMLIGIPDLTNLSYLHEPGVLYNLEVRFCENNDIYTYCGIVLVAINPYTSLPLYTPEIIDNYRGKYIGELDPHIFAVAEDAYSCLFRNGKNQSIIVSGESGAGKTVNAKLVMRFFATVGGNASDEAQIEKKILASNPVMESLGNAKTTRNDNSSRFGKYIEIAFNKRKQIKGARMRTYLLEKSRVIHQAATERNYHIFYQLCSSDAEATAGFELIAADSFNLVNQGGEQQITDMDDAEEFAAVQEAMETLAISTAKQRLLFQVLSSLLHLGNVVLRAGSGADGEDTSEASPDDAHLAAAARLLGVDRGELTKWITHRKIVLNRETIMKPLVASEAVQACHALAKNIYASVFEWVVKKLNRELIGGKPKKSDSFIGVLDIYGFETFKVNSFEQFCINYANEKLQQIFNQHIFKLEQEEYQKEEIQWEFIDFQDNQPCIDLIEHRTGVIALLDEECRIPKGNDINWVGKLDSVLSWHKHFQKARLSNSAFKIQHYADTVEYEASGFLEKNRDTFSEEHVEMLRSSDVAFVAGVFEAKARHIEQEIEIKAASAAGSSTRRSGSIVRKKRPTVARQFHSSLDALMATLGSTEAHYVRCIKPNDKKISFEYDRVRCAEQVRACGVLETIKISAAGFPSRWSYSDFLDRYSILTNSSEIQGVPAKDACEHILAGLITETEMFQFGLTKIFFRAGQIAHLEVLRDERLGMAAVKIQKCFKGWRTRRAYTRLRSSVMSMQCHIRGWLARAMLREMQEEHAATVIQSKFRAYVMRRGFVRARAAAITIQATWRGFRSRAKSLSNSGMRVAVATLQSNFEVARKVLKTLQNQVRTASGAHKRADLQRAMNGGLRAQLVVLEKMSATAYSEVRLLTDDLDAVQLAGSATLASRSTIANGLDAARDEVKALTEQLKAGTGELLGLVDGDVVGLGNSSNLNQARALLSQARDLLLAQEGTDESAALVACPPDLQAPTSPIGDRSSSESSQHLRSMVMDYLAKQQNAGASHTLMKENLMAMVRGNQKRK